MNLLTPIFLAGLGLLVPIFITFLVRRQRQVMRVPSTMVWRRGARTTVKNRRLRDLRRLLALLACLLGVGALVVASARPSGKRSDAVVFVVDVSASMEGGPLAEARRALVSEITALGPAGRVAMVTAGGEPRVVLPPSPPGPLVDQAIESLTVQHDTAAMDDALTLAEGLASGVNARVIVVSDEPIDADLSRRPRKAELRLVPRGKPGSEPDNLGIASLFTRSPLDAREEAEREAVVVVATSSKVQRRARLVAHLDGKLLADHGIVVPPQADVTEHIRLRGAGKLVVRVKPDDGKSDALASDDEAFLFERKRRAPRVALVRAAGAAEGPGVFFVKNALKAAGVTELDEVDSQDLARDDAEVAVVLDDGPARPKKMPTLFLDVEVDEHPMKVRPVTRAEAKLRSLASEESILRGVSLDDVTIMRAKVATEYPRDAINLIELDAGPVLLAGGAGPQAWVWFGLAPEASDLVLRVGFPVLIGNILAHLGGSSQIIAAKTVPRSEVMLATSTTSAPLPAAPAPRWRFPAGPSTILAALGAFLLGLEAWLTFRRRWAT